MRIQFSLKELSQALEGESINRSQVENSRVHLRDPNQTTQVHPGPKMIRFWWSKSKPMLLSPFNKLKLCPFQECCQLMEGTMKISIVSTTNRETPLMKTIINKNRPENYFTKLRVLKRMFLLSMSKRFLSMLRGFLQRARWSGFRQIPMIAKVMSPNHSSPKAMK